MTHPAKRLALAAALALGLAALAVAQAPPPAAPAAPARGREAVTVYVDLSILGRKHRAAEKLSQMHAQKAAEGFTFAGLAVYTENGDIQGFFVTYVREP